MTDTVTNSNLYQTKYGAEVKTVFDYALTLMPYVKFYTSEFKKGNSFVIPTASQLSVTDYAEGNQIEVEAPSTSTFTMTIDNYKQSGFSITDKAKDDLDWLDQVIAYNKSDMIRAHSKSLESGIADLQASQTASNPNSVDGADHRFVSVATTNLGGVEDFALAMLALNKSSALDESACAHIDGTFLYRLQLIGALQNSQTYSGSELVKEGGMSGSVISAAKGTRSNVGRISGFNVFTNNSLNYAISQSVTATAAPWATGTVTTGYANMFLGREALVGAIRTQPEVEMFRDYNHGQDVWYTKMRWTVKLYRPESLVVCLTDLQ